MIVMVYDVTKRNTLTHGVRDWVNELKKNCDDVRNLLLVLVGNKVDVESHREVDKIEAQEYAKELGALYCEASAKTGLNVEKIFTGICAEIDENKNIKKNLVPSTPIKNNSNRITLEESPKPPNRSRCCNHVTDSC